MLVVCDCQYAINEVALLVFVLCFTVFKNTLSIIYIDFPHKKGRISDQAKD